MAVRIQFNTSSWFIRKLIYKCWTAVILLDLRLQAHLSLISPYLPPTPASHPSINHFSHRELLAGRWKPHFLCWLRCCGFGMCQLAVHTCSHFSASSPCWELGQQPFYLPLGPSSASLTSGPGGFSNVDKGHQLLLQDICIINIISVGGNKRLIQSHACGFYLVPALHFTPTLLPQLPALQTLSSSTRCEDDNFAETS